MIGRLTYLPKFQKAMPALASEAKQQTARLKGFLELLRF
jgi:hypothetical protein